MKNCEVCLWRSPPLFNSQECEGMRSRMLAFEASGIDHVGLIQICFSAEATVSRVCEKTVWSKLDSLDQDIKHVHSNARSECNAVPEKSPV